MQEPTKGELKLGKKKGSSRQRGLKDRTKMMLSLSTHEQKIVHERKPSAIIASEYECTKISV